MAKEPLGGRPGGGGSSDAPVSRSAARNAKNTFLFAKNNAHPVPGRAVKTACKSGEKCESYGGLKLGA